MESPSSSNVDPAPPQRTETLLSDLFGSYRAEWLEERLFDLFTEPSYFPELTTSRPCVLIGGRGTGKTTVLKCLSYSGQFALRGRNSAEVEAWPFYGFYYRVNTNYFTAFDGPELSPLEWMRLFGHYINLQFCDLLVQFLLWYSSEVPQYPTLSPKSCQLVALSLNLGECKDIEDLASQIESATLRLQSYINSFDADLRPRLSLRGAPIDVLAKEVRKLPHFKGKLLFFLVDEYENFSREQQQLLNTLVKHAGSNYTFKIGVRELGIRCRTTLNENEQLISPADYSRIEIDNRLEPVFSKFASEVCNERLKKLNLDPPNLDVVSLFPELSEDDEAILLGVDSYLASLREELAPLLSREDLTYFDRLPPLQQYLIGFWSRAQGTTVEQVFRDCLSQPGTWSDRYGNYKHALLFTIKRRKGGIRKYYSGWKVFTQLAGNNIRYLLQLVEQSILAHVRESRALGEPISAATQTQVAQEVGRMNLKELDGLSINGAKLTKLLLALGRIFGVMAAEPEGHTPEINQFNLAATDSGARLNAEAAQRANEIIEAAVMHLALVRLPGSKLQDSSDIRDYDYAVHSIYAAFFSYSYRRKRKMILHSEDIILMVESPKEAIAQILKRQNRVIDDALPDQLALFEAFYANGSR